MRGAWDEKRVASFVEAYGYPWDPSEPYRRRMELIAQGLTPWSASILDVGCGIGHLYGQLHERARINYRGIDWSEDMVDLARSIYSEASWTVGDAYNLNDHVFPAIHVVAVSLLIHIVHEDLPKILKQLWSRTISKLQFTIPITQDLSRVDHQGDPEKFTVITHVSEGTLRDILAELKPTPKTIKLTAFPEGVFGYPDDYLVELRR